MSNQRLVATPSDAIVAPKAANTLRTITRIVALDGCGAVPAGHGSTLTLGAAVRARYLRAARGAGGGG